MDLFSNNSIPSLILPNRPGYNSEWSDNSEGMVIDIPNGQLFYYESFFPQKISDRCVEYFQENSDFDWRHVNWKDHIDISSVNFTNIKWKQDVINMFGNSVPLPRLTSWYGDPGKDYIYSGIKSKPNAWNQGLLYLKHQIEAKFSLSFNSVLINWYRDGDDHMSWHSDDEAELGVNPVIASANFGQSRDFVFRRKDDHSQKITISLKHGSLLLMQGEMQKFWEHSVPKRKKAFGSRFNLTFRSIIG